MQNNPPSTSLSTVRLTIPPDADGMTLEQYLRGRLHYSRRMLTRLKARPEYVLCNGVHLDLPRRVSAGDVITLTVEEVTYTAASKAGSVPIVYEDAEIILYRKPYGMPIHPSRSHQSDTLANVFTADMSRRGCSIPFRVINRLDRDTDGLCLCAKTAHAAHQLSLQQQDGRLQKEYTAVLCGKLPCQSGIIEAPIARRDPFYIDRMVSGEGQYAKTGYKVIAKNEKYTAVCVNLYTGRTHQIRVHFSFLGYPLAGDTLYPCATETDKEIKRHALCCTKLAFSHPSTGESLTFCTPLLPDMRALFAAGEDL